MQIYTTATGNITSHPKLQLAGYFPVIPCIYNIYNMCTYLNLFMCIHTPLCQKVLIILFTLVFLDQLKLNFFLTYRSSKLFKSTQQRFLISLSCQASDKGLFLLHPASKSSFKQNVYIGLCLVNCLSPRSYLVYMYQLISVRFIRSYLLSLIHI